MEERIKEFLKNNSHAKDSPIVQLVEAHHRLSQSQKRIREVTRKELSNMSKDIEDMDEALLKILEQKRSDDE